MIYFDNAATTPVRPEVADLINQSLREDWGNPSSLHHLGFEAEKIISRSRKSIGENLGVDPSEIIFTSCATEANNMVIHSFARFSPHANIVISPVEHDSVLKPAQALARLGLAVRIAPVDQWGRVDPKQLADLVDEETVLVSVMHINNELGTIEPIEEIGPMVKAKNPHLHFHVDNVQGVGKLALDLEAGQVDSFSASAHKIMAPKGIGFLYLRRGSHLSALMYGGGQEKGMRPGTENTPYIAGLAKALDLQIHDQEGKARVIQINQKIRQGLLTMDGVRINTPKTKASPYILNVGFSGIKSEVLLHSLETNEIYISTGSACSLGAPSHVLEAVKVPAPYRDGCIRISFQAENQLDQVDPFLDALKAAVTDIRRYTRK